MRARSRLCPVWSVVVASALLACSSSGGSTSASSAGGGGAATTSSGSGGGIVFPASSGAGAACGHEPLPMTPTCDGADAGPPPTFAHDIVPILAHCTGELCHATPTYRWLVGQPTLQCCDHRDRVAPGDPAKSYLVTKLSGVGLCGGKQMPYDEPPLPAASQATIVAWICAGAPRE